MFFGSYCPCTDDFTTCMRASPFSCVCPFCFSDSPTVLLLYLLNCCFRSLRPDMAKLTHRCCVHLVFFFQIPLPVTTGLFLYLGVSGLNGNEMWERTKLLVTDANLRPKNVRRALTFLLFCVYVYEDCMVYNCPPFVIPPKFIFAAAVLQ